MGKATQASVDRDDEGHLVLKGELFWKWKATHTAIAHCDAEVKARTPVIDALLDQQPELKRLLGERSAYVQQAVTMRAEYKAVLAELEKHLGFSMQNVSIDDVTGRVHRLDEAQPAPAQPAVKNGVNGHPVAKPKGSKAPATSSSVGSIKRKKRK